MTAEVSGDVRNRGLLVKPSVCSCSEVSSGIPSANRRSVAIAAAIYASNGAMAAQYSSRLSGCNFRSIATRKSSAVSAWPSRMSSPTGAALVGLSYGRSGQYSRNMPKTSCRPHRQFIGTSTGHSCRRFNFEAA